MTHDPLPSSATRLDDGLGFPYHPLVYHLDLSILAYHLYAQTLVLPLDPFYEQFSGQDPNRAEIMRDVRTWASAKGQEQATSRPRLGGYRGPGRLAGFPDNPLHDPILYRYDGIDPWSSAITHGGGEWIEYLTPNAITGRIRDVYMCHSGQAGTASVERVASNPAARTSGARDLLFAFEGGTGDKGEAGQPASQSLMGFVLLRYRPRGSGYDIHISFRGSRSGSLLRTVALANWTSRARGNPDWITDLGYDLVDPPKDAAHVTAVGNVHRGFAKSIQSIFPNAFACLEKAAAMAPDQRPRSIYITGHSLGGGLAQHFVSAMVLGTGFGPNGAGDAMPRNLRQWPWSQIKLITFSAPRAGDPDWAETLTTRGLASDFHAKDVLRYDANALAPNDPDIASRLDEPRSPVGYRVLVSTDPVSTSLVADRKPVGKTVYVDKVRQLGIFAPHKPSSHEPAVVRDLMIASLNDPRIPDTAWQYRAIERATASNRKALEDKFLSYHRAQNPDFDYEAYERNSKIFDELVSRR